MAAAHHALDGVMHDFLGIGGAHRGGRGMLEAVRISAEALVLLLQFLVAGQFDLGGVDDDDEIAAIHMGGEIAFVLAAQELDELNGHAAGRFASGVDEVPLTNNLVDFG